jgi:hypothetical protein
MLRHGGPTRGGLKFSNKVLTLLIISNENKELTVNSNRALYSTCRARPLPKYIYSICDKFHALVFRIYIPIPFILDTIEINNSVHLS